MVGMKKKPRETRERAAWRFDPRFLNRLRTFVASQELQTTQTSVIEAACYEYMNRKDSEKKAARR